MDTKIDTIEKYETFVRIEKHIKNENASDTEDVAFECSLPCHPNIGDGTGADYWRKQGFRLKSEYEAEKKAQEELKAKLKAELEAEAADKKKK